MFDTPERLNYSGLPDYPAWYSCLKYEYVLTFLGIPKVQENIKKKGGKQKFAVWLRYYNDLEVAPGLEALKKMRAFYT